MFFKELSEMMPESIDMNMVIRKQDDQLAVSVHPHAPGLNDPAKNRLQPVVITGTPEELDKDFLQTVKQPVTRAAGLLTNMQAFEASYEQAEAVRREAREKQKQVSGEDRKRKDEFAELLKQADEAEKEGDNTGALDILQEAKEVADPTETKKLDTRIAGLKAKSFQKSLF